MNNMNTFEIEVESIIQFFKDCIEFTAMHTLTLVNVQVAGLYDVQKMIDRLLEKYTDKASAAYIWNEFQSVFDEWQKQDLINGYEFTDDNCGLILNFKHFADKDKSICTIRILQNNTSLIG